MQTNRQARRRRAPVDTVRWRCTTSRSIEDRVEHTDLNPENVAFGRLSARLDAALASYGYVRLLTQRRCGTRKGICEPAAATSPGLRLEAAFGSRATDIAPELGTHFERGRDFPRAVRYLTHVACNAAAQGAHYDAIACLERALGALCRLRAPRTRVPFSAAPPPRSQLAGRRQKAACAVGLPSGRGADGACQTLDHSHQPIDRPRVRNRLLRSVSGAGVLSYSSSNENLASIGPTRGTLSPASVRSR
jgi:hypothetical protein